MGEGGGKPHLPHHFPSGESWGGQSGPQGALAQDMCSQGENEVWKSLPLLLTSHPFLSPRENSGTPGEETEVR